ncbi:MAG: hypothetical protein FJ293_08040 [Planctomycetes bacterium]|nr:hypothetical protein [Planctomycetota bacterium]
MDRPVVVARRRHPARAWACATLTALVPSAPAAAQTVEGTLFHDLDRDGVRDAGEPWLANVAVTLYGEDGLYDRTVLTGAAGDYSFAVSNGLKYVLDAVPGIDWRLSFQDLGADADPIPDWPQGRRRPGLADFLVANLRASAPGAPLLHVALGDSIAYGFNLCDSTGGKNDYVRPLTTDKLDRAGTSTISKQAVLGYETRDLLDPANSGTIFAAIALAPQLVTISIGGNDFLADDGNHAQTAANLVAARQNLQELLSTLLTELPDCDVILNTVYDNEGGGDGFHNEWGVIWNQVLRDVAWGQRRRVAIAEVWPDYEHEDPATGTRLGEDDLICQFFGLDAIHPKKRGYDLHEEKVWQGLGGVTAGAGAETRHFGFLQRIGSRFATVATDVGGGASALADALVEDDVGAVIPAGNREVRLSGFDATPDGMLAQVVAKVRYRTVNPSTDDDYRFEAAIDGAFAAPGATSSTWNTIVPIVGGAGNGVPVLAGRDQGFWRDVSALLTDGAEIDGRPSLAWGDLANLSVRAVGLQNGGADDSYDLEWDVVELELWGIPPYTLVQRGEPQIGTTIEFDTTGRQGSDAWLWASAGTGTLPFPPFGTFGIDFASAVLLDIGPIGANGARTVAIDLPADPTLIGFTGYVQALVVDVYKPKAGAITNLLTVTLQ